ncbi:MAG: condensation domain-containing protein, partial [Acidobacteriota bacterium]
MLAALEALSVRKRPEFGAVLLGGEALTLELAARTREVLPWAALWNVYGPTEATANALLGRVRAGVVEPDIGRPLAGHRAYVLDRLLRPVTLGSDGELVLGGAALARGYLGRPGRTAETFVPDPFTERPHAADDVGGADRLDDPTRDPDVGARMYRTGDRVRHRADGRVLFLGRIDQQIKLRGLRIELGEIESQLRRLEGVADAAVMLHGDGDAARLVAYVVRDEGSHITEAAMHARLSHSLPAAMVPARYVMLDALPRTATDKLDRRALPAPDEAPRGALDDTAFELPETEEESILAEIWADVLDQAVGPSSHFFRLGGHSLLATRVVARVRAELGVRLPLRALFEQPTLRDLATTLADLRRPADAADAMPAAAPPAVPLEHVPRGGDLPLSFAQERLWLLDQLQPGDVSYTLPIDLLLEGVLDVRALAGAFAALIARHESLRTRFVAVDASDGQRVPFQRIDPPTPPPLPLVDLTAIAGVDESGMRAPDADGATLAAALQQTFFAAPFDLARGPLLRLRLLRLRPDRHRLMITMHHIVSDGWSTGVLLNELAALYAAARTVSDVDGLRRVRGLVRYAKLAPLPVQYADIAVWQRRMLAGGEMTRQLDHWRAALDALPVLELPVDRPRTAIAAGRPGASVRFRLPVAVGDALKALAQRRESTLFIVLLALFHTLLARLSGQRDVAVGSPIAGRNLPETEGQIGFFVNTLVLRTRFARDPRGETFDDVLARVRDTVLDAFAHPDVPFERLVAELQPTRDLAITPLFQVLFGLQNQPGAALALPG